MEGGVHTSGAVTAAWVWRKSILCTRMPLLEPPEDRWQLLPVGSGQMLLFLKQVGGTRRSIS